MRYQSCRSLNMIDTHTVSRGRLSCYKMRDEHQAISADKKTVYINAPYGIQMNLQWAEEKLKVLKIIKWEFLVIVEDDIAMGAK